MSLGKSGFKCQDHVCTSVNTHTTHTQVYLENKNTIIEIAISRSLYVRNYVHAQLSHSIYPHILPDPILCMYIYTHAHTLLRQGDSGCGMWIHRCNTWKL